MLKLLKSRSMFGTTRTGKIQNLVMKRSYSCLCSTTLNEQRKAIRKRVFTKRKKWQHVRPNNQDTAAFLGAASASTWWNGNSNDPQGHWDVVADILKCHTANPIFRSSRDIIAWGVEEGGRHSQFQGIVDNKKLLAFTILASNCLCIYNRIYQWYEID